MCGLVTFIWYVLTFQSLDLSLSSSSLLAVTVQCTRDRQFVVVAMRDATLPQLSLESISLLGGSDPPCGPVGTTVAFAIYQFPVTACGTMMVGM